MRYDSWDVILFSNNAAAPIQEFKTTCFESLDDYGCETPTLRSYISSVAPGTPFRISLHNWELPYTPSAIIESRRRSEEKIVLSVRVVIDGVQNLHTCFDASCKWPQEIAHAQRWMNDHQQPSSERLKFPSFDPKILMHTSWRTRSQDNTITVTLSEQLVRKFPHHTEDDLGFANTIVCFAFQHAPRAVLEQAGIAYPIRNPLYLPSAHGHTTLSSHVPPSYPRHPKNPGLAPRVPIHISPETGTVFGRPQFREVNWNPRHQLPPDPDQSRIVGQRGGGGRTSVYDEFTSSFIDIDEDVSMSTWPSAPYVSDLAANTGMLGPSRTHERHKKAIPAWNHGASKHAHQTSPDPNSRRLLKGKENANVAAPGDEQLSKALEATSPSKKSQELSFSRSSRRHDHRSRPLTAQTSTHTFTRPVLTIQAQKSSYVDLHDVSKILSFDKDNSVAPAKKHSPAVYHPSFSSDKENRDPSQSWLPTQSSQISLAPTPNTFSQGASSWKSDTHMKNASSIFPNLTEYDQAQSTSGKINSAHAPSGFGSIKSRKEGMARPSDHDVRHDQGLLPNIGSESTGTPKLGTDGFDKDLRCTPSTQALEIIDIDAIDSKTLHDTERLPYFRPSHKSGMSSIDSTVRLERTLYSALGEELGSFGQQMDTTNMGPELAQALAGTAVHTECIDRSLTSSVATDSEPVVKRKRQNTLGSDRGRSPTNKKEKSGQTEVRDEDTSKNVPR